MNHLLMKMSLLADKKIPLFCSEGWNSNFGAGSITGILHLRPYFLPFTEALL